VCTSIFNSGSSGGYILLCNTNPYFNKESISVCLEAHQQSSDVYEIWLNISNLGPRAALDVLVEYSIKGVCKSKGKGTIPILPPQIQKSIQLMSEGQPLLHDRNANRIIQCKLTCETASGRYKERNKTLDENEFFKREYPHL
jgi:hypothetical protein